MTRSVKKGGTNYRRRMNSFVGGEKKNKRNHKSRKQMKRKTKKQAGGFASVIKEALVPFTLFALQKHSQRKMKKRRNNKTAKRKH